MLKLFILTGIIVSASCQEVNQTSNINYVLDPNSEVIPVVSVTCSLTQLTLYVSYNSTTNLAIYVYPPYINNRCDLMGIYYTAFGPPAIPESQNLTAWYISSVMNGLTCFGIQNVDKVNTAYVSIDATMNCNNDVVNGQLKVGWYHSRPTPSSIPINFPSSSSSSSSTGSSEIPKSSAVSNKLNMFELIMIGISYFVMYYSI